MSRRAWMAGLAVVAAGLAAGCAGLFGPRTIEVSQAQLQEAVERRFPIERRYLELLDVTVAAPRVMLRPEVNRLATEFQVLVSDRVFRAQHRGTIALNYGLRFDPSDNTVRLTNVRIDRFDIDGAPALLSQQLDRVGVLLAEQTLNERPVYTLRPKDVDAIQSRGYRPSDLRVTPNGLTVTLLPESAR
ncbi:MAG: DUF1439 domain-containing protein [Burkholderiales bacterium]